jgi:hypothetical protein
MIVQLAARAGCVCVRALLLPARGRRRLGEEEEEE